MIFRSPYPELGIPEVPLTPFVFRRAPEIATKPALIDGPSGRTLTYGQLEGAIRRVAAGLNRRGFSKGDVFAIYSPNLPEYVIAFHAVSLCGGTVTTVNPMFTEGELAAQLQDAGARMLLTIPPLMPKAAPAAQRAGIRELVVFGEAEGAQPFAGLLQPDGEVPQVATNVRTDIVALPYSSGTTGLPKGVMLTHFNLVANICQTQPFLPSDPIEVLLGVLPFYHIYGLTVLMNIVLSHGQTLVTLPRFELPVFLETIHKYRVTRANLVPPIILALAKHPLVDQYDLSSLRSVTSGAAPLDAELSQACATRLHCLVNQGYGLTETSPVTNAPTLDPATVRAGSVGQLIPNTEARIVDVVTGQDLNAGQDGEVWLRGPQVMKGYWKRPKETAETIDPEGWLHSGDIGHFDPDGYLYIVDRLKELIKYKGYQVAPAELEALLLTHPAVADAAVVPVPDAEAGEVPKAYVVLKQEIAPDDLLDYVAQRVAPYKRIRRIEVVSEIPKATSGKILRRVLVERERTRQPA
jgi:acyl-CoA synthetase (AMP-forming)/AMP-acid ligase II